MIIPGRGCLVEQRLAVVEEKVDKLISLTTELALVSQQMNHTMGLYEKLERREEKLREEFDSLSKEVLLNSTRRANFDRVYYPVLAAIAIAVLHTFGPVFG